MTVCVHVYCTFMHVCEFVFVRFFVIVSKFVYTDHRTNVYWI